MMHQASRASLAVFALLGSWSAFAHAEHLQVIARHGQRAPGDTGNFRIFGILEKSFSPAISGGNVAFGAITDQGAGIYAFIDQRLRLVADTKTEIPGTSIHFGFDLGKGSGPSISGRNVVFVGVNILEGGAIWLWSDGVLTKLVDYNTPVPGGTGTFGAFGSGGATPAISGDNVAFSALSAGGGGIYAVINGDLRVIADTNTLLPGATQTVTAFGFSDGVSPAISGENVVFFAKWSVGQRLYLYTNGEYRIIADTNTPKPGSTETFGSFGLNTNRRPGISGENVAFTILGGVFAYITGSLHLIADSNTGAPGTGTFGGFFSSGASIDGDNVAFGGWGDGIQWAICSYIDGEFRMIASEIAAVPGIPTTFFSFGILEGSSPAISGENVVFMGRRDGIYVGDGGPPPIPAVSAGALTVLVILLLAAGTAILLRRRTHEVSSS